MSEKPDVPPVSPGIDPRAIAIKPAQWDEITKHLQSHPEALFFDKHIRTYLARVRAKGFDNAERWSGEKDRLVGFAIDYNEGHMKRFLESHVVRLIRPLSVIDPIYETASRARVLSIGPRNENELFHLAAYGFDLRNIEAIDLVSNSPLVTIMDMHDLRYPNDSFDVVISGWTLPYSKDPKKALAEKMRVLKPGGLLCIGLTRVPPDSPDHTNLQAEGATSYLGVDQILADIGPGIANVEFRQEPLDPTRKGALLLIARAA